MWRRDSRKTRNQKPETRNQIPPFAFIIFGITSNLAQIKILPALYDLVKGHLLPQNAVIVGAARAEKSDPEFKKYISQVLRTPNKHHPHPIDPAVEQQLLSQIHYVSGNVDETKGDSVYPKLKDFLSRQGKSCDNHLFYLATYPNLYGTVFSALKKYDLNNKKYGWVRLMIEKPFGHDLLSAKKLDNLLHEYFSEDQIYRLDHYLGKETIQNILTFRFGNSIFEPLINKDHIDHIQITAAEDIGIGKRGDYYDKVGAFRDVGQNHQLQMLAFATMNAPIAYTNAAITKERLNILEALKPFPDKLILGQYQGYPDEDKVAPTSQTDTFYALKTEINNDRFKSVPVYIRAGKKMARYVTEINIVFKHPDNRLFYDLNLGKTPNILTYRIFPDEGVGLQIIAKDPGHDLKLRRSHLQYCYHYHTRELPDAYEKLIYAAVIGDQTFFNDSEEIEAQWAFADHLLRKIPQIHPYRPGSWGPPEADELIESDGRSWIIPSEQFCKI